MNHPLRENLEIHVSPMAVNGFAVAGVIIFIAAAIRIGANSVRFVFCRQPKQADSWRI